jgi:hypothetical protein
MTSLKSKYILQLMQLSVNFETFLEFDIKNSV